MEMKIPLGIMHFGNFEHHKITYTYVSIRIDNSVISLQKILV